MPVCVTANETVCYRWRDVVKEEKVPVFVGLGRGIPKPQPMPQVGKASYAEVGVKNKHEDHNTNVKEQKVSPPRKQVSNGPAGDGKLHKAKEEQSFVIGRGTQVKNNLPIGRGVLMLDLVKPAEQKLLR